MPNLADIPGLAALRSRTQGDPRVKIAVLDGPVDRDRACFQGANFSCLDPYWAEEFEIPSAALQTFLGIENSGKNDEERGELLKAAIPDENVLSSLALRFHASHVSSVLCGQPDSPVAGIAANTTVINIPIAYSHENFINPLNLARAISTAIELEANIIHCAACHPTQSSLAHEFIDKAIRQAQANNILIVAPAGNDKGECWCIPAVLEHVLAVGAMNDRGEPFRFSNFGGQYAVQGLLAPGENILGAQPGTDVPIRKKGTSCAAPIVTGVAALLMSLQLERGAAADAEAVRAALINSAIPCDPDDVEEPERCLVGRLHIPGAYELLMGESLDAAVAPSSSLSSSLSSSPSTVTQEEIAAIAPASAPANIAPHDLSSDAADSNAASTELTRNIAPSNAAVSPRSNLVYVLGTLDYDFRSEIRRDTFKQLMPAVNVSGIQVPANPYDARQMVNYLETNPSEAQSLIWTLNLDLTPTYVLEPVGAFAADVYEVMQYMLAGQNLPADDVNSIERISIPGYLSNKTIKLFSGQVLPVLQVNSPRGMYGWNVNTLVDSTLQTVSAEQQGADLARIRRSLISFLNRVYYDLSNLGQIARDRALNFAATNAFQAVQTFSEAVALGMELDSIDVEKSPFCRYGSECWDIKLKFFDPENTHRARKVFRFTLDVQDIIPVTLGEVRSWSVSQ